MVRMRQLIILMRTFWVLSLVSLATSQVVDSFDDGNFNSNPVWTGETGYWEIITNSVAGPDATGSKTLHLNFPPSQDPGTKYISTQRAGSWGTDQSWGFWVGTRTGFNNPSVVWLWANESNLNSATVDGYRSVLEYSQNRIILQRVDDGSATDIISVNIALPVSDYGFLVRFTRTSGSVWTMYTSTLPTTSGGGASAAEIPTQANTTVNHGNATDATYTNFSDGYFGFMATYLGFNPANRIATEFDQLYFDTSSDASLPVKLTSFTATADDGQVTLKWTTESEFNNDAFLLERSEDGEYFYLITEMDGQGTTTESSTYSYIDNLVFNDFTYFYRLSDRDINGVITQQSTLIATPNTQGFNFIDNDIVLNRFALYSNYPNPFNPETNIRFDVPTVEGELKQVKIQIINSLGQMVETLYDGQISGGQYELKWNGTKHPTGVYFLSFQSEQFYQSLKMVLVK